MCVSLRTDVTWCFSIFHCQPLSLFASAFPPSFLCFKVASFLPSLLLPVLYLSPFLSSCCYIWLPDLSSVIPVHPLHFDVSLPRWPQQRQGPCSPFIFFSLVPLQSLFILLYTSFFYLFLTFLLFLWLCIFWSCSLFFEYVWYSWLSGITFN